MNYTLYAVRYTLLSLILLVGLSCSGLKQGGNSDKIKVVVVTGGHGFKESFFSLFDGYDDIEYVNSEQKDHSEIFEDIRGWDYDVVVLFNMTQKISDKRKGNFLKLLDKGVGVVALHHCIGAFQNWPEYRRIIGGRYYLTAFEEHGQMHEKSGYDHDVDMTVHIEDNEHPVTRGISDFVVHDEVYNKCVFESDNYVILSTNHPASDKSLAWVRKYSKTRVCYIQMGHGTSIYSDKNYRRLVAQAIRWSADRLN
jgi:type 1 glutamine amidotransferase